jgi:spore maturation protein CgeB
MRILVLNTDYPKFLSSLYRENPGLEDTSYSAQMAVRNATMFGGADFYSRNFVAHGHVATELHINNRWIQHAWAREHGVDLPPPSSPRHDGMPDSPSFKARIKALLRPALSPLVRPFRHYKLADWEAKVMLAQIEDFRPDVILNQEITYIDNRTLRTLRARGIRVLGQLASPLLGRREYDAYDLVISSLPNLVAYFRAKGVKAELNRLAFEPAVLDALGPQPPRNIDLSFVGSLLPEHHTRIRMLEFIAERAPLRVWGNGIERLPSSSPLQACYQGEAWGRDMYNVLRRSRITLNRHIDMAEGWANNMRLYEATGMGAMLLTDAKRNLAEIFRPGVDVATYTSDEDCVAKILHYLADEPARAAIAAAGQKQAVETQTYYNRTGEIIDLIRQYGLVTQ